MLQLLPDTNSIRICYPKGRASKQEASAIPTWQEASAISAATATIT